MSVPITCGELADLAARLPPGDLCDWCNLSATGPQTQVVFADSDMLSRCQEAASTPKPKRAKKKESDQCTVSKTTKEPPGT